MSRPLISCIVPAFNSARYIAESLESILDQTYVPLEVVVVDDGSKDDTVKIATSFRERVRVIQQDDRGPAATRNRGVEESRGGYLAFLDADDRWHPDKLQRQMTAFANDRDLDICLSLVTMFWGEDMVEEEAGMLQHERSKEVPGYATTTLLAPRRVLEEVGPFSTDYWFADAVEWFVRARSMGKRIHVLPEVLTYHRMHPGNLTRRRSHESREEFLSIVAARLHKGTGRRE